MNKIWTVIIIILVIAAGIWWFTGNGSYTSLYPASSVSPTASVVAKSPTASTHKATPTPATAPALSYSQLVAQYGANRIQFDNSCQAQPKSPVFKNGASILLDNRANQARVISINGMSYNLGPYGYQVVTVSSSSVPKNIGISCNNQVNVGTIQLQAEISGQ